MAIQTIGIGTVADDGTGDSLRVDGDKINDNVKGRNAESGFKFNHVLPKKINVPPTLRSPS